MENRIKMVLIVRKDLKMRTGKVGAQCGHAASAFMKKKWLNNEAPSADELAWLQADEAKICVYVNTEAELIAIHEAALAQGLASHLITDNGLTEFHGVKTKTCVAIGPANAELINAITGSLPLL